MADRLLQEDGTSLYLQEDGLSALIIESGVTVTPNTADLTAFATLTPTLEFTGVQTDDDDVRYQVQVDTVNTFNSNTSVIDSYAQSNLDNAFSVGNATVIRAQSFTGNGSAIGSASFLLSIGIGVPVGIVNAVIYAHSGTYGVNSVGTGAVLATSDNFNVSTLTSSYQFITFIFSGVNQIVLTNGTNFVVGVQDATFDGTGNFEAVGIDSTSPTHSGNGMSFDGTTWSASSTYDLIFTVASALPLLTATSGTDPGFLNTVTPADTDPFTNNQKASYTAQTALAAGTYFWRARALDPLGTNAYGAYSTTRSFTTSAGGGGGATPRFRSLLGVGS